MTESTIMRDDEDIEFGDEAIVFEGSKARSSVQSVRFATADLNLVRAAARREGVTTSEFIRVAALDRATGTGLTGHPGWSYGSFHTGSARYATDFTERTGGGSFRETSSAA
jgi:hypothetical protein